MGDPRANGATTGPYTSANKKGDAPRDWPNTIAACVQTGLQRKQLDKLVERGALKCERDSSGVWRWDPELLAMVAEARGSDDDDSGDALPPVSVSQSGLNGQALVLLRQAQGHTEAAFKLVLDPMRDLLRAREQDIEGLRARVKELEGKLNDAFELREKMLSEQHVRDMLTADAERANQRKDRALQLVESHAPKLLAAINPAATAVVGLMRSLNDEQRGILLQTDFLTAEQKQLVQSVLQATPPAAEKKDEPAA